MRRVGLLCLGALLAFPAVARGDAVLDWNVNAQTAILSTGPTAHASTLSFAMVHGAVYDAVNAIDRSHRPYLHVAPERRPASQDAAAATAAFRVLASLYPAQLATLQTQYDTSLAKIEPGERRARGIAVGERAAAAMLAARADDGRLTPGTPYPYPLGTEPGAWRVSPPLTAVEPAWWVGNVRPFIIPNARWFASPGPNPLWSRAYARDFNEVKTLGAFASPTRTADQTMAAIFWQAPPMLLYGGVARELSSRYGLSTAQNARLFGMLMLGSADASIACWNDKYRRLFWRPIDAIHLADTDGNPATEADPSWRPLFDPATPTTPTLATPNFPDHPSGHSCVSSAVVHVLQDFFHSDRVAFDVASPRFPPPNKPRHFERFSALLDEIIEARVWAGIHFRTADVQGAQLGAKVVRWQRWTAFQPVRGRY